MCSQDILQGLEEWEVAELQNERREIFAANRECVLESQEWQDWAGSEQATYQ